MGPPSRAFALALAAFPLSSAGPLLAQGPGSTQGESPTTAPAAPPPPASPPAPPRTGQPDWTFGQDGPVRLTNISLDLLFAIGSSTARDDELLELKGGEHDPRKRGVTIQQAELQLNGAVDRHLTAQGVLVAFLDPDEGETIVELEEAWLQTETLPHHLQLKAGHYFTEFGRINPLHPHAWDWQDQPVILTRVFGAEGMRAPGARLSWLAPTHHYLELFGGVQNANGETMTSFLANDESYEERAIGGRLFPDEAREVRSFEDVVFTARIATTFDVGPASRLGLGASAAFGPNPTGGDADTAIYGVDFVWLWQETPEPTAAFVRLQGELLARRFAAAAQVDASDPSAPVALPARRLDDYGGYVYGLVGFASHWAAGLRVDWAGGSGASYLGGGEFARAQDPFRTDRLRISPLLQYRLSPAARVRLQYDYDDSDHLADDVHSLWLGFEIMLGAQPVARVGRDGLAGCGCR